MEHFYSVWENYTNEEYSFYGFSYVACAFGGGTGNRRLKSTDHADAIWDGMAFLGRTNDEREYQYDQREISVLKRNVSLSID